MRNSPLVLREQAGEAFDAAQGLINVAESEQRDLTAAEKDLFDQHSATARAKIKDAERLEAHDDFGRWLGQSQGKVPLQRADNLDGPRIPAGVDRPKPVASWTDGNGQPVYCLGPQERLSDLPLRGDKEYDPQLSMGRAMIAMVTGDWKRAPREVKAMKESQNSLGGYLVPEELGRQVIDLARARSVIIQAGAQTIPMSTDRVTLARVSEDPDLEVHAENEAFTEVDVVFDGVGLTAFTIGCVVRMSRELAADAINGPQIVEDAMVKALAAEIDRQCLVGTGSAEMLGLVLKDGIGSTASVGAIAWEDLATAYVDITGNNHMPTGYVVSPTIAGDLDAITSGDGTNSAKLWLGPPPGVDKLTRFATSNVGNDQIVVGDFSKFILGLRQDALVESTITGHTAFTKHSVLLKVTWRGDCNLSDAGAFHLLDEITT